jgi:fatty acid desaturase
MSYSGKGQPIFIGYGAPPPTLRGVPLTKTATQPYALRGDATAVTSLADEQFENEVEATWFTAVVDRRRLKSLMRRSDARGWRHFGAWLVLLIGSGYGVVWTWLSWRTIPFLVVYGLCYAMSDHHAHELSHGTPFKNRAFNETFYHLNAFMTLHEAYYWRWSHTRHHTHTLVVGRDPEIALQRPPKLLKMVLDFFFIAAGITQLRNIVRIAFTGTVRGDGQHFVPISERGKVVWNSRFYAVIFFLTIALCFTLGSILPAVLVVTPRFWGGPFAQAFNITQHAGLPENVNDHRRNCRTVVLNPIFAFLYVNMNYHVEHHMFPMVPFHALPELHDAIKDQCAPASRGVVAAWRELLPALLRQRKMPTYSISRDLPPSSS